MPKALFNTIILGGLLLLAYIALGAWNGYKESQKPLELQAFYER